MIFSCDRCIICKSKLEMKAVELWNQNVAFQYYCNNKELIRNESDTFAISHSHYTNTYDGQHEISKIIIPPYQIENYSGADKTNVYKISVHKPRKLVFESGLLDFDYAKPYVAKRLKALVIFS
jgi:hypothetical protein